MKLKFKTQAYQTDAVPVVVGKLMELVAPLGESNQ